MATIDSSQDDRTPDSRLSAGPARWTWLASGALFAGAAVTALAPRFLPGTAAAAADLARHGLTWPLLGGFALVLAALASTSRRPRDEADATHSEPTGAEAARGLADDPLAREITNELARVRGGLHDLRVEFVYVKDGLARLLQSAATSDSDSGRETEAAIFRLAASLDQLGGRIEHEIAAQRAWLQDALEREVPRAPVSHPALPGYADPYVQGFEGAAHEIEVEPGYRASADDLHVEVSLDDEAIWTDGLGVLDEIEEPRAPLGQVKTSPSGRPVHGGGLFDEIESGAAELEGKMSQLRHLLSDPSVQRALDARAR